jgi:transcriptional regulator with GAF, ATPase, and Fis domain
MADRDHRLLLDVWREACQHTEIAPAAERIFALLAKRLPLDLLMVRQLDTDRLRVETVALGQLRRASAEPPARSECRAVEFEQLVLWCRRQEVIRCAGVVLNTRLAGLLPAGIDGEFLVAPLNPGEGMPGVLLMRGRPTGRFRGEHEEVAASLREPFTVALENDRRLRELRRLREALEADNRSLLSRLGRYDISDSIVGAETGLRPVMKQVELVARADVPVLILGETGSGKEVVARAIHGRSRRAAGPFLRVNCGAIPPELVDSELFGHERGSFTGAVDTRKGWFERADGGTLFLDECGELPPAAQVRLLRILQDGSLTRVGGDRPLHVDVRIVAATHRDLPSMVAAGTFRDDLWYRLAVFPVRLPPLRERREDVPALAAHFALRAAQRLGAPPAAPTPADLELLAAYDWPGNVRELAAVIERAAILGEGKCLKVADALGTGVRPRRVEGPASAHWLTLDEAMARHIQAALAQTVGRIEGADGAARLLAINPHTLRARMRKLGIDWQRFRPAPDPDRGELRQSA